MVSLGTAQIVLDRMEIGCSSVSVYRERSGEGVANGMAIRYDILHSLSFVAIMTRNLFPGQTGLIPDISVKLEITDEILVRFMITHSVLLIRGHFEFCPT